LLRVDPEPFDGLTALSLSKGGAFYSAEKAGLGAAERVNRFFWVY
jgi:hypothetical protein